MNRMIVLVVTLMVIAPISIIAQNSMPIMQAFVGRSGNSWFGKALVAFDFNADGYDDVAIGEPSLEDDCFKGRIRIYTGNAQLEDTTVVVDDATNPPPLSNWGFRVIPNPSRQGTELKIQFIGNGYDKLHNAELRIFNIRGQHEFTQQISAGALKSGEIAIDQIPLTQGVHLVAIYEDSQKLKTQKVTIK